jgi:hypothetical protein
MCTFREEKVEQQKAILYSRSSKFLLQELQKRVGIKDKVFLNGIHFAVVALCTVDNPVHEEERKSLGNERQFLEKADNIKHECEEIFYGIVDMVENAINKEFYSTSYISKERQRNELKVLFFGFQYISYHYTNRTL